MTLDFSLHVPSVVCQGGLKITGLRIWHVTGVSDLLASLGHTGRRRDALGYTLNTQTLTKTDEQKEGPGIIFMISPTTDKQNSPHMWPVGCRLDTPVRAFIISKAYKYQQETHCGI